jgi:hypothetical protein
MDTTTPYSVRVPSPVTAFPPTLSLVLAILSVGRHPTRLGLAGHHQVVGATKGATKQASD